MAREGIKEAQSNHTQMSTKSFGFSLLYKLLRLGLINVLSLCLAVSIEVNRNRGKPSLIAFEKPFLNGPEYTCFEKQYWKAHKTLFSLVFQNFLIFARVEIKISLLSCISVVRELKGREVMQPKFGTNITIWQQSIFTSILPENKANRRERGRKGGRPFLAISSIVEKRMWKMVSLSHILPISTYIFTAISPKDTSIG